MERVPGLFQLGLIAAQGPSSQHLNYRMQVMHKLKRDIPGRFTNCAASNLLGVFLFYRKKASEAIKVFKDILAIDKDNLNAIENLIFVFQRLQMPKYARIFEEQKETSSCMKENIRATYLAEQAFAYRFDCYMEKNEMERCQKCIDLYNESLNLFSKSKNIDSRIIVEVKSWLIQCLQQKHNACVRLGDHDGKWESYNSGVKLLKDVLGNSVTDVPDKMHTTDEDSTPLSPIEEKQEDNTKKEENNQIKGENVSAICKNLTDLEKPQCDCNGNMYWEIMAWTFLGVYLSKNPNDYMDEEGKWVRIKKTPEIVIKCNFEEYFVTPEKCFHTALEIMGGIQCLNKNHINCTESLIRYALFLRYKPGSLTKASELVDRARDIDDSDGNWFALMIRSQINETRARKLLGSDCKNPLGKELLEDSITDAEKALIITAPATEFARLGEIYRFKAVEIDNPEESEISRLKASENFMYAVQSIGDEKRPEIHRMQGKCFSSFGEDRQAIECFKRGIATDSAEKETLNFKFLFETFLKLYKKQKEELCPNETIVALEECDQQNGEINYESTMKTGSEYQNVLHEMVYWFKFAFERYGLECNSLFNAKNQCPRRTSDMKKVVKKFTESHGHEMADMAAYFEIVLRKSNICEYIESCSDSGETWTTMLNDAKAKWTVKHPHAQKRKTSNLCSICGSHIQNIARQNSIFPGPQIKARNVEYEFDFFVIYSKKDEDWVLYYLITGLETTYGFKGAVSDRDFHPGSKTLEEMNRIFDQSFKVMLILSDNFNKDPLCAYGMCQAQTKQLQGKNKTSENYIIPIMKSSCNIPPQLVALHVLDAVFELDWEKLALSLESKM